MRRWSLAPFRSGRRFSEYFRSETSFRKTLGTFVVAIGGMAILGGTGLFPCGKPAPHADAGDSVGDSSLGHEHASTKTAADALSALCLFGVSTIFGALGFFLMALLLGEPWPHPTRQAWLAWGYLVLFGSIIAYSFLHRSRRNFPATIAMTFAYVCPVLAVLFGALLLNETISPNKIVGMVMILGAVYLIFKEQQVPTKR